jgi:hypothetical protein
LQHERELHLAESQSSKTFEAMLDKYQQYSPKLKNFAYLRTALKNILSEMLQVLIDRAVLAIHKGDRLSLVQVNGSHFEHGL